MGGGWGGGWVGPWGGAMGVGALRGPESSCLAHHNATLVSRVRNRGNYATAQRYGGKECLTLRASPSRRECQSGRREGADALRGGFGIIAPAAAPRGATSSAPGARMDGCTRPAAALHRGINPPAGTTGRPLKRSPDTAGRMRAPPPHFLSAAPRRTPPSHRPLARSEGKGLSRARRHTPCSGICAWLSKWPRHDA